MTSILAPTGRRRVLVIFNPVAGPRRARRLHAVVALLKAAGCTVLLRETAARGDAERFAAEATMAEHDVVLAAGGDGTLNEVANGLGPDAPLLAVCPLGTANVVAAEVGLAIDPAAIAATVLHGKVFSLAPGLANGRRFLMMAGVGFDAHVVAGIRPAIKRRLGKGAYVLETLRQLWRFNFPGYRLTIDGVAYQCASAIIAKGHFYAGRFICAPDARLDDPRFQICVFRWNGPLAVVYYALAMGMGLVPRAPGVTLVWGSSVEVTSLDGDPVQGDGDTVAVLPLTASVAPARLRVLVPA